MSKKPETIGGVYSRKDIQNLADKCRVFLDELVPDANWAAVEKEPLWIIHQLGEVLIGAITLDVIESFINDGDLEGFDTWYKRVNEIGKEYAEIRTVYNSFIQQIYNAEV